MSQKILVLKPESLGLAYLVAPFAGMATLWACFLFYDILTSGFSAAPRELFLAPWLLIFGIPLCGIAELLIVTPFLWGFRRYRWRWLNGWTACLLGYVIGALPALFIPNRAEAVLVSIFTGLVGLTVALVFRLMAVEAKSEALPVQ